MKIIYIHSKKYGTKECFVDDADYEWLNSFNWCLNKSNNTFYAVRAENTGIRPKHQRGIKMHRLILGLTDPKKWGEHKDRNGLNNQRNNLRFCNPSQNAANKPPRGESKFLGVSPSYNSANKKRWQSTIKKNGICTKVGTFDSEEDAARAYDAKAKELHGEFANLNFK